MNNWSVFIPVFVYSLSSECAIDRFCTFSLLKECHFTGRDIYWHAIDTDSDKMDGYIGRFWRLLRFFRGVHVSFNWYYRKEFTLGLKMRASQFADQIRLTQLFHFPEAFDLGESSQKYLYAALLWHIRRPSAKKKLSDWVSKGALIISSCCSSLSYGSAYTYCHWLVLLGTQKGKLNSNSERICPRKKCFSIRVSCYSGNSPLTFENSRFNSKLRS